MVTLIRNKTEGLAKGTNYDDAEKALDLLLNGASDNITGEYYTTPNTYNFLIIMDDNIELARIGIPAKDIHDKQILLSQNKAIKDAAKEIKDRLEESLNVIDKEFSNAGSNWKILAQEGDYSLIVALDDKGKERKDRYVVAYKLEDDGSWGQCHYFTNKSDAMKFFNARNKTESLDNSKPAMELYGYEVTMSNEPPEAGSFWLRVTRKNQSKPEYYLFANNAAVKECYKEIVSGVVNPADISDIALGYTTIDGDPQLSWQDYADNFTPYTKPEVEESAMRMSDDYLVGNGEDGRIYHGIASAVDAIRGIVTRSGDPLYVQNISLADNVAECDKSLIVEYKELSEDPSEALSQLGYKQSRNENGEILYHSDERYSPDISVFGSLIEIIPLSSEELPISMTIEDHGRLVKRLAEVQKFVEDLEKLVG